MTTTPALADGETFVDGRSQERAIELLALAEAAGLKGQVVTTSHGYIVPTAIFDPADEDENPDGQEFDPSAATIAEVKAYLDGTDDVERARVIDAEKASAKPRTGVLELAATPEGEK